MDQHELRIATFRRGSAWLVLPAILLIATAGAAAYFFTNLPAPFEDWMLLAAAAAIVLFAVVLPWWVWASRSYIVTTRRVIETRGLLIRRRREILHQAGYMIEVSRGPLQRMLGRGTLSLGTGDGGIEMRDVHSPKLVRETLSDQIEVCQILAHRQAQQQAASPYLHHDVPVT
ncbi:MAG: PH domain-containing protein [Microbacterium gubbeenense]|uniref:PH domain-containing protein n=1 Tax=Microbacterium gubbeenense TaxID=159896 RepID=UPI0004066EBF|nr:PH domain-containing protein [Microbacterium gubbeenense]